MYPALYKEIFWLDKRKWITGQIPVIWNLFTASSLSISNYSYLPGFEFYGNPRSRKVDTLQILPPFAFKHISDIAIYVFFLEENNLFTVISCLTICVFNH